MYDHIHKSRLFTYKSKNSTNLVIYRIKFKLDT